VFGLDRLVLGVSLSRDVLKADLRDVVEGEFKRISSIYGGCKVVDNINIDWGVKIESSDEVENELPFRFTKFIVRGSEVFSRIYRVEFVAGEGGRVLASIEVYIIGGDCYVVKRVYEDELEGVARGIEVEASEGE
jgi:hypothetical protein